jgi:predicted O-linked N-acetylglucosamine transferase (SPINDLY family)
MSHKEIATLSRSLEIDIAIDLSGTTQNSRTEVFSMSAAPIQTSYIGWLGTMGADYYDYLIAANGMIPEKNHKYFSEKIVYLPTYQVNDSKETLPENLFTREDLGLPKDSFVFCCFNNTYKITPIVFDSWARILNRVEKSVMMIYVSNKLAEKNLIKEIKLRGIDPARLVFGTKLTRNEYLDRYRSADLFLDTFPYNAGTTASDALKMGLPILTLNGNSFNSKEAANIISAVNLSEMITTSQEEYESLAVELANNPMKYRTIKDKLVDNLSDAPLYNTRLFAKNIESAYKTMFDRYHKGLDHDHIHVKNINS